MQAQSTVYGNTSAVTLTTAWTVVALTAYPENDGGTSGYGGGQYGDHFEIVGTPTNAPTAITYCFTYDIAGNDPASAQVVAQIPVVPGGTLRGTGQGIDICFAWDKTGRSAGVIYFWAKTDVATSTLALAAHTGFTLKLVDTRGGST